MCSPVKAINQNSARAQRRAARRITIDNEIPTKKSTKRHTGGLRTFRFVLNEHGKHVQVRNNGGGKRVARKSINSLVADLQKKVIALEKQVATIQDVQHRRKVAWNKVMNPTNETDCTSDSDDSANKKPAAKPRKKPKWLVDQTDAEREEERANWQRRILTPEQRRLEQLFIYEQATGTASIPPAYPAHHIPCDTNS
jgi:hypothetical protein